MPWLRGVPKLLVGGGRAGGAASSRLARQKPAGGLHALAGACQAAKATEVGQPTGKRTALGRRGGTRAAGRARALCSPPPLA